MMRTAYLVQPFRTVALKVFECDEYSLLDTILESKVGIYSTHTLKELATNAAAHLYTDYGDPQIKSIMNALQSIDKGTRPEIRFIHSEAYDSMITLTNGTEISMPNKNIISLEEPYPSRFFAYCVTWINHGKNCPTVPVIVEIEN